MAKVPPFDFRTPVVDPKTGTVTVEFQRWLIEVLLRANENDERIETLENP